MTMAATPLMLSSDVRSCGSGVSLIQGTTSTAVTRLGRSSQARTQCQCYLPRTHLLMVIIPCPNRNYPPILLCFLLHRKHHECGSIAIQVFASIRCTAFGQPLTILSLTVWAKAIPSTYLASGNGSQVLFLVCLDWLGLLPARMTCSHPRREAEALAAASGPAHTSPSCGHSGWRPYRAAQNELGDLRALLMLSTDKDAGGSQASSHE